MSTEIPYPIRRRLLARTALKAKGLTVLAVNEEHLQYQVELAVCLWVLGIARELHRDPRRVMAYRGWDEMEFNICFGDRVEVTSPVVRAEHPYRLETPLQDLKVTWSATFEDGTSRVFDCGASEDHPWKPLADKAARCRAASARRWFGQDYLSDYVVDSVTEGPSLLRGLYARYRAALDEQREREEE